ncbi:MAG: hypothetical protein IPL32_02795 [Chloracidobacterium sp.]|nr:hypothetical protein [Chloracidobacterium sp.]
MYKFISVAISRELLTFETEEKGGIRYRFKGKVLQGDMKEEESPELGGDIVGKLEKFKNGSVIAAIDTTFFLFGS